VPWLGVFSCGEEREFSTGFVTGEAVGEARWRFETTPIGRFIPLNPRDGAEMAFPGALRLAEECVRRLFGI